jgi:hypothetical protein
MLILSYFLEYYAMVTFVVCLFFMYFDVLVSVLCAVYSCSSKVAKSESLGAV